MNIQFARERFGIAPNHISHAITFGLPDFALNFTVRTRAFGFGRKRIQIFTQERPEAWKRHVR